MTSADLFGPPKYNESKAAMPQLQLSAESVRPRTETLPLIAKYFALHFFSGATQA